MRVRGSSARLPELPSAPDLRFPYRGGVIVRGGRTPISRAACAVLATLALLPASAARAGVVVEGTSAQEGASVHASALEDEAATTPVARAQRPRLGAYRHLGTWIDMFDAGPWKDPEQAVRRMKRKGVTTLYLQTANYRTPARRPIFKPGKVGRFIDAARGRGIKVVAWYLPGFKNMKKDWRRTKAALNFKSSSGKGFHSFAMDIESTAVSDISKRNNRMARLSKRLRTYVGANYPLGGIVPDVHTRYWPSFPYATVHRYYNVIMPMAYFSYRVSTFRAVRRYIHENIDHIRAATGNPNVKIHAIGGIAGEVGRQAARGYARAVMESGTMGGSYYDYPITTNGEWIELGQLSKP